MHFRSFIQYGTSKIVAINMDLVEVMYPAENNKGTMIQFQPVGNGEANHWQVTDDFTDLVKSLRK